MLSKQIHILTVIKTLIKSGIDQFDVASIEEIKAVRKFSQSSKVLFYAHR